MNAANVKARIDPVVEGDKVNVEATLANLRQVLTHLQETYAYHITVDGVKVGEKPGDLGMTLERATSLYKTLVDVASEKSPYRAAHGAVIVMLHGDKPIFTHNEKKGKADKRKKRLAYNCLTQEVYGMGYRVSGNLGSELPKHLGRVQGTRLGTGNFDRLEVSNGLADWRERPRTQADIDKARELEEKRRETARLLGGRVFG